MSGYIASLIEDVAEHRTATMTAKLTAERDQLRAEVERLRTLLAQVAALASAETVR
jgi:hypothetical protein